MTAVGANELIKFSTGLGRFRFGGDEEGAVAEKERVKFAAKLEARPVFPRRTCRTSSGERDALWLCWDDFSVLLRDDLMGGVSPQEYDAEFGSLPQAPPLEDPNEPYKPTGVCAVLGVEPVELYGIFSRPLKAAASEGKYSKEKPGVFIDSGVSG